MLPWPLPSSKQVRGSDVHNFEERRFLRPHYCDHCLKLIVNMRSHFCCTRCEFRVHSACLGKAQKLQTCWQEKSEKGPGSWFVDDITQGNTVAAPDSHVHHMREVFFHKPTWCDACGAFVHIPRGYRCIECRYRTHHSCIDTLQNCVVLGGEPVSE